MKKFAVAAVTVIAAAAVAVGVASGSGGGGTVVYSGFACNVFDGNGNLFTTFNSETIVYSNQQGSKAVLRCSGNGAGASALTYLTGFGCNTQYGFTTNSVDKIGYNGNSQLTCTVDLSADTAAASGAIGAAG